MDVFQGLKVASAASAPSATEKFEVSVHTRVVEPEGMLRVNYFVYSSSSSERTHPKLTSELA